MYLKARELCERIGETPELFSVLFGLWRYCVTRPKLQTARELADTLLRLADNARDPALAVIAHYAAGFSRYQVGEFIEARQHQEEGIARYAPEQRRIPVFRHRPRPRCRLPKLFGFVALAAWVPGSGASTCRRWLGVGTRAEAPFHVGYARCWLAWACQFRRDAAYVREQADAAVALATEQGFPLWAAKATIHRGWALAMEGKVEEGMLELERGVAAWRATGAAATLPFYYAMQAEAFALQGKTRRWPTKARRGTNTGGTERRPLVGG